MADKKTLHQYILTNTDLKKLHAVLLELLVEFDRICRKYDIPYSIDGGTLLGAVRHGGFIPWDDDADVIMNRSAYDKFVNIIDDEVDTDKYYFQDIRRTKGFRWGYGKFRKTGTKFVRLGQEYMPYEQGVFIDVFVCDNVPDNYVLRSICNFHSFLYRKAFYSTVGVHTSSGSTKMVYYMLNSIPEEKLKTSYFKYIKRRNRKETHWVKCLTFPAINKTYGYKRSWYADTVDMRFEGKILRGCRKYDEYLTFMYGDYMKLPPVDKRKCHPVSEFRI